MTEAATLAVDPAGHGPVFELPGSALGRLDELESQLAELAGVINAAQGQVVSLVATALAEGLWAQPGIHSPGQWLAWQLGLSSASARRIVGLARRAEELPETIASIRQGSISLEQASVVGRNVPATHEVSALRSARQATVSQLERTLGSYAFEAPEPAQPRPGDTGAERRDVSFTTTETGRWRLHADLPVDEGAHVEAALAARRESLFRRADDEGERRAVSWADALLDVAGCAMSVHDAESPGRSRVHVIAHLEADPVDSSGPEMLSLHLGSRLPSSLARLLLCDCDLRPVWERHGVPVSMGRATRVVSRRLRRLVEHRDGGCRVPGCERRRGLQIHHVRHWRDGGSTDTANLVALCARHHRAHHLGLIDIAGDADRVDGIRCTDRHGRRLRAAGRPRAPDRLPPADDYAHPSGEPLDRRWLWLEPTVADGPPIRRDGERS